MFHPRSFWDSVKANCPAHLDWASLRGKVVVISVDSGPAFPDEIAGWNETLQGFQGQPALFIQVVSGSEFLLDQALKATPYHGCILLDSHEANRRNFEFQQLPRSVVVDQFGYIAGYDHYYPDERAIRRLIECHVENGLFEEPPRPQNPYADQGKDLVPSHEVHISPAAKDERRLIGYTPEPDLYITRNQPLKIIIVDLWNVPPARISLPENLDQGNYDITARIPVADSKLTRTLVREAVEKRLDCGLKRRRGRCAPM